MTHDPTLDIVAAIIRAVTEPLAQQPNLPALDLCDLRWALTDAGRGYFGEGTAEGAPFDSRAIRAADIAIANLVEARRADGSNGKSSG